MAYVIVCNARRGAMQGVKNLFLCDQKVTPGVYWTSDDQKRVMRFRNKSVAEASCTRMKHNNCRVVPFKDAMDLLEKQRKSIREFNEKMGTAHNTNEVDEHEFNR